MHQHIDHILKIKPQVIFAVGKVTKALNAHIKLFIVQPGVCAIFLCGKILPFKLKFLFSNHISIYHNFQQVCATVQFARGKILKALLFFYRDCFAWL
jgi:hypothetical protein